MKSLRRLINKPKNMITFLCRRRCGQLFSLCCTKSRLRWIEDIIIDILDFVINKGMRALGPILAFAATCLISLVVYEYFEQVFPHLLANNDNNEKAYMAYIITCIGIFILINIFFNHQSCVWTSPGHAPLSISLYPSGTQQIASTYYKYDPELSSSDVVRYCNQCQCYKPWRAHHCSICSRCILKMDHHCPWMWNCVGYANYRYFFMFLFYLWTGTLFYVYFGYDALFQSFRIKSCAYPWLPFFFCRIARLKHKLIPTPDGAAHKVTIKRNELFVFTYFLCIGIFIVMIAFLGFHTYLIITNQSTLETMTNFSKRARSYRRFQRLKDIKYVYKLTILQNIKEIMGEKWYLALLPIWTKPRGNGYIYPLTKEIENILFSDKFDHDSCNNNMTLP